MILWAHHQKEGICSASFPTNFVPLDWTLLLRTWQRTYSFWNWLMSCWFYTVRLENACKNVKKKIHCTFSAFSYRTRLFLTVDRNFNWSGQILFACFVTTSELRTYITQSIKTPLQRDSQYFHLNSWLPMSLKEIQNQFSDSFGFQNPILDFLKETRPYSLF